MLRYFWTIHHGQGQTSLIPSIFHASSAPVIATTILTRREELVSITSNNRGSLRLHVWKAKKKSKQDEQKKYKRHKNTPFPTAFVSRLLHWQLWAKFTIRLWMDVNVTSLGHFWFILNIEIKKRDNSRLCISLLCGLHRPWCQFTQLFSREKQMKAIEATISVCPHSADGQQITSGYFKSTRGKQGSIVQKQHILELWREWKMMKIFCTFAPCP